MWYVAIAMSCGATRWQPLSWDYLLSSAACVSNGQSLQCYSQYKYISSTLADVMLIQETIKFLCKLGWIIPMNIESISQKAGISISIAIATPHLRLTQHLQHSNYSDLWLWTQRSVINVQHGAVLYLLSNSSFHVVCLLLGYSPTSVV
jgi:hypothetical protein